MESIKAAIFDIDNTLIDRGYENMPPEVLQAILQLQSNGIETIVATGRGYYFIVDEIKDELKPNYTVTINGGAIYDKHGELFYHTPMLLEDVNTIITKGRELDLAIGFKAADAVYVMTDYDDYSEKYLHGFRNEKILIDFTHREYLTDEDSQPVGAFIIGDNEKVEALIPHMKHTTFVVAYDGAYDIFDQKSGKEIALNEVLKHLNITWDNVIAFGDSANDVNMVKLAKIGVAMGNGTDQIKEIADYVTKPLWDLGIKHALKKYKLI
jgi:Cof subfamily protein (haloacid dehalogenase superfamily)